MIPPGRPRAPPTRRVVAQTHTKNSVESVDLDTATTSPSSHERTGPMPTLAVYHTKGGVGKTATAVNLAYLAAQSGAHTLLCDLDPQSAATFYFRVKPKLTSGIKTF